MQFNEVSFPIMVNIYVSRSEGVQCYICATTIDIRVPMVTCPIQTQCVEIITHLGEVGRPMQVRGYKVLNN